MIGDFRMADDAAVGQFVKGFATIDHVTLVNVEVGPGMTATGRTKIAGESDILRAWLELSKYRGSRPCAICSTVSSHLVFDRLFVCTVQN